MGPNIQKNNIKLTLVVLKTFFSEGWPSASTKIPQGIVDIEARNGTKSLEMQCFPLFTLLLALGSPTVDFLSLDIEVF